MPSPARSALCAWRLATGMLSFGCALLLTACDKPPVHIPFVSGVTGRAADLGVAGRDAATLAIEQANAKGGLSGRPIILDSHDDRQDPDQARDIMKTLAAAGHKLVLGPMISSVGVQMVPEANRAGVLILSPTVTTAVLSGKDDQFFRVISTTDNYARKSAEFHTVRSGWRRYAIIRDDGNQAYTHSWSDTFAKSAQAQGAQILSVHGYVFRAGMDFSALSSKALQDRPDAVVILASAVDTARIAQALRKQAPKVQLISSEWAATEQLLALGGQALEGMHVGQFHDRESTQETYQAFVDAFSKRFGRTPGFAELASYDTTRVALQALAAQQPGESLKATLLRVRRFEGVQQPIVFDDFGDSTRETYITVVQQGRFRAVPP